MKELKKKKNLIGIKWFTKDIIKLIILENLELDVLLEPALLKVRKMKFESF